MITTKTSKTKPAIAPALTVSAPRRSVGGANVWQVDAGGFAAVLGISALAYFFGAVPLLERHARAASQVTELTAAREKSLESAKMLDATKKQVATAKAELAASPLHLQPLGQLNQRLAMVADIAARSGATLDDVQPGKAITGPRYDTMPVRVSGVANYPAFAALLHCLRSEFPDSGIEAFDITINSQNGAAPTAKFGFDLVWYTRPAAAHAGAAETVAPRK